MDEKVWVTVDHLLTREEAEAIARRLVEQMEAQRLLREAEPCPCGDPACCD